jgi:hypothetical protein
VKQRQGLAALLAVPVQVAPGPPGIGAASEKQNSCTETITGDAGKGEVNGKRSDELLPVPVKEVTAVC